MEKSKEAQLRALIEKWSLSGDSWEHEDWGRSIAYNECATDLTAILDGPKVPTEEQVADNELLAEQFAAILTNPTTLAAVVDGLVKGIMPLVMEPVGLAPTETEGRASEFVDSVLVCEGDRKILAELQEERQLFTKSDPQKMAAIIEMLIERRVYPRETPEGNPNSVNTMVDGYGAYWHIWTGMLDCPHCGADQRDHEAGAPFMLCMSHTVNDRCAHYTCHECLGQWSREDNDAQIAAQMKPWEVS